MNLLRSYISNFLSRKGSYVFLATIFARLFSFLAAWFALKLVPNKELGVVLFAYNIILFIIPISGLGLHQSFLRYGALLTTNEEKNSLFLYVLKKGLFVSLLLITLISIGALFIDFQFPNTKVYLILLSFIIIPSFLLEIIKAQLRLNHDNKKFAYTEITQSILLLINVIVLSYFFTEIGYAIALVISPIFTSLLFIKKIGINFKLKIKSNIIDLTFWKYGFFASLSNVVTQLLFVIDILLIGYLLSNTEMVTNYRYISLIPFSLLFLPRVFIATDFVAFTEKIYDKNYIKEYIKSYMLLFLLVSIFLLVISYFFGGFLLTLLDDNFAKYTSTFFIMMLGVSGIFIFRGLFGNLLSSIGKANVNYYIAIIALILNIISNYYLIPKYGIKGAAITSAVLMWLTGLLSFVCFKILYKKALLKVAYTSSSAPKLL
ncbi:polysaccharide biosynthesis C-terminal domain-containing protein [Polaribacter sp. MSW13]|uniref:Polysaccharide biosynthesis C-terminal domain-containing protein n=1 Tax=Polaribacter marinus TaxID=2916838 RepID=A0A9X1VNJ1_9FLAO|nr:polysaccharide biosynthesis C-terminal domain-containing protein [Polaribacter marinus]MCI2229789.1 polysaccharide biosynthesis C-terminal domain-containing protein [Polaribacter marinus]